MKKEEFDKLGSHIYLPHLIDNSPACPLCEKKTTHPTPDCNCRKEFGEHVMKYHHTCNLENLY